MKCNHDWLDWHAGPMGLGRVFWECRKCGARTNVNPWPNASVQCPHCKWGFHPSVIQEHIREKHNASGI